MMSLSTVYTNPVSALLFQMDVRQTAHTLRKRVKTNAHLSRDVNCLVYLTHGQYTVLKRMMDTVGITVDDFGLMMDDCRALFISATRAIRANYTVEWCAGRKRERLHPQGHAVQDFATGEHVFDLCCVNADMEELRRAGRFWGMTDDDVIASAAFDYYLLVWRRMEAVKKRRLTYGLWVCDPLAHELKPDPAQANLPAAWWEHLRP